MASSLCEEASYVIWEIIIFKCELKERRETLF